MSRLCRPAGPSRAFQGIPTWKSRQAAVRHSPEWLDQLKGWQERKKAQKKVFGGNSAEEGKMCGGHRGRAYTFYLLYFFLATGNMWLCMTVSPQHYNTPDNFGTLEYVGDLVKNFGKIKFDGFYDGLIISVVVLETVLFFMAASMVSWPKPALIRKKGLTHKAKEFFKHAKGTVSLLEDEQAGLVNNCCLLIACHESCLTPERTATFSATLRAAMDVFPPRAIFVCDNGNALHPVDQILDVCKQLSRERVADGSDEINYLYIPEGNKTHAMYWATEYWIPELVRRGKSQDYTYAMIIDDDVPIPPDLHVPNNMLNRNTRIKAIAYVIQAACEDANMKNQLVELQDLEYKMAGLVKQFQLKLGTSSCCHGAIALWRRDVLGRRILWDHDTVFHGEDLYMGLLLHRMGQGYKIGVSAGAVVPTFAPEKLLILFRQRVTSWDLCAQRKFMTFVKELFRWGGCTTMGLKPFMFQEVVNILLDWMRCYLVFGLAHRNPVNLILCFFIFYGLLWFEICVFNYVVMRTRKDLQVTPKTLFLFPFYRTLCLIFRLYALVKNVIQYSSWRPKNIRISERESTVQDMPPVPPDVNVDWWTIWHINDSSDDTHTDLKGFTENLMEHLHIANRPEKRRLTNVVQAYLLYMKLLQENSHCNFPLVLRDVMRNKDDVAKTTELLVKAMETLRKTFVLKLENLIQDDWEDFKAYLHQTLEDWSQPANSSLFLRPDLMQPSETNAKQILDGNLHVMGSISQLVYLTNYPQNHDKVAELKVNIKDLIGLLEIQIQSDRRRQNTAVVLNNILSVLEQVKQLVVTRQSVYFPWCNEELTKIVNKVEDLRLDVRGVPGLLSIIV